MTTTTTITPGSDIATLIDRYTTARREVLDAEVQLAHARASLQRSQDLRNLRREQARMLAGMLPDGDLKDALVSDVEEQLARSIGPHLATARNEPEQSQALAQAIERCNDARLALAMHMAGLNKG